uniref:Uncharacterized protein n=1 Tax=Sphenodon punctatus TaxID=8508 RepID=A0A8D0GL57_SPHPU
MEDVDSPGVVHKVAIRRVVSQPSCKLEVESSEGEPASPCSEELLPKKTELVVPQLSGMDKVYSLLTRAKVQLYKIDQQKQLKSSPLSLSIKKEEKPQAACEEKVDSELDLAAVERKESRKQGQESPVQGPRIKHVCRHASVALGQSRAMVPEDVPRLSALPLREREEITASPTVEGECRGLGGWLQILLVQY